MQLPENADQETSSDLYASRFRGAVGEFFLQTQEDIITQFLTNVEPAAQTTILEVGGGHGQLIPAYKRAQAHVTIVGSDDSCQHRISQAIADGSVSYKTAPLNHLPFPDQSFDTVIAIRLLTHAHDWHALVQELCRVAKKNIIIDYPGSRSWNILYRVLYPLKKASEKTTRPFFVFSDAEIKDTFARHGFIVQKKQPQFFLPMVVYRKLNAAGLARWLERLFHILFLTQLFGSPTLIKFSRT